MKNNYAIPRSVISRGINELRKYYYQVEFGEFDDNKAYKDIEYLIEYMKTINENLREYSLELKDGTLKIDNENGRYFVMYCDGKRSNGLHSDSKIEMYLNGEWTQVCVEEGTRENTLVYYIKNGQPVYKHLEIEIRVRKRDY